MDTIQKYLAEDSVSHSAEEFEDCSVVFLICSDPLKLQVESVPSYIKNIKEDIR